MRHGKARAASEGGDHGRKLDARGRDEAARAAEALAGRGFAPDLILSSSADRALATATVCAERLGALERLWASRALYLAPGEALRAIIAKLPPEVVSVILVGHNPGLEELAEALTGHELGLKTGALLLLEFECDEWSGAGEETALGAEMG